MDEPLLKSLERYDVLERIAVGGMAEVFLAKAYGAHGFEKTIAIKRILPELARDPEFEARFIAEAKVAVRLSHANVVQVLDFGHIGESLFIAMEFVDGLDLAALLRKFKDEGRLVPLPAAFHIAIEIMRALDFAHSHNVVHRDVSPSNILISRAGEVKIADFGIAVAAQPRALTEATQVARGPRRVMGKWRYMSPEQTRGDTLDTRSDLFSAAAVIYELFTGEKLFPGEESDQIIKAIDGMTIPKLSVVRPGLPSRLDDVLGAALARKPIDRPARPAIILRQLIELSYESSIMATALDVAEAVASVMPAQRQSGRGALDDVIRKQMHDHSEVRQTAVTDGKPPSTRTAASDAERKGDHSTGLFRMVDPDGLARLEVEATRVAAPRAKRMTGQEIAVASLGIAADAADLDDDAPPPVDRDRRTEVGGPPTGQIAKLGALLDDLPLDPGDADAALDAVPSIARTRSSGAPAVARTRSSGAPGPLPPTAGTASQAASPAPAAPASRRGRTMLAIAGVAGLGLAVAGYGVWRTQRVDSVAVAPTVAPRPAPEVPGPVETTGTLEVDSVPAGAIVTIAGRLQGAAPRSARVTANRAVRVKLELAGYTTYEGEYEVKPNTIVVVHEKLAAAPAQLVVDTTPTGATVTLDGQPVGLTPLDRALPAHAHAQLVLAKVGFEPQKLEVDLAAGLATRIDRVLKAAQKFGTVSVEVSGTALWAEVAFKGKSLGRTKVASGLVAYRLPVGRQTLRLTAGNGRTKSIDVTVTERAQTVRITFE